MGQRSVRGIAVLLSLSVASLTVLPAVAEAAAKVRYFLPDHLGSTNVVTNETGAVVEVAEYRPFGELAAHSGTANVPQKFTGQRLDAATGFYFYHARYYDPQLGRFMQPDAIIQHISDPQDLNPYTYCRNNPVTLVDPSGYGWFSKFLRLWVAVAVTILAAAAIVVTGGAAAPGLEGLAALIVGGLKAAAITASAAYFMGAPTYHAIASAQASSSAMAAGGNVLLASAVSLVPGTNGTMSDALPGLLRPQEPVSMDPPFQYQEAPQHIDDPLYFLRELGAPTRACAQANAAILEQMEAIGDPSQAENPPGPGINKAQANGDKPAKKPTRFWDRLRRVKPKSHRGRRKDEEGSIYEWDPSHGGELERYNKRGKHTGVIDPDTGEVIKRDIPGRTTPP